MRRRGARWQATVAAGWLVLVAAAQHGEQALPEDVQRMIREGMIEALDARYRGTTRPEELHQLARAAANKARRARPGEERTRAFEQAAGRYRKWIEALEKESASGAVAVVRRAAARVEFAGLVLSGQAAADLDEFEITLGQRGDRKRLEECLKTARTQYERAAEELKSLGDDLAAREEELLAAGVYELAQQTRLDLTLNLGWTLYYLGRLAEKEAEREAALAAAERSFQALIDEVPAGPMRYRCHLAAAVTQRERRRYDDALRNLRIALGDDADPVLAAQVRYEWARTLLNQGQFDEARAMLRPLVDKDPAQLAAEGRPARFYINLAHLWDAYSHLLEAAALGRDARDTTARTAVLQKAQRSRETGLNKLRRLARQGGPWPALVQLYVAQAVNLKAPLRELTPLELVFSAGTLIEAKRYREALERLAEAARRPDLDPELRAEVLYETGRCHHALEDYRAAAEAFERVATEHRRDPRAPAAAGFAYALWGKVAEKTQKAEDYLRLAAALRNLIENYADHPQRTEAVWLLPVALQAAGAYAEAADQFAKVPPDSQHWEEAQYRRALCGRQAVEAARETLSDEAYAARARAAAAALVQYADAALARSEQAPNRDAVRQWSALARASAAELLVSPGVADYDSALAVLGSFETHYPGSDALGRVLAVRIRAHRGLREFARASQVLQQYLQSAPAAQLGGTLAALARGMKEEVERLLADGQTQAARALAADAVATFDELEKWVRADPARAGHLGFVSFGRAELLFHAGRTEEAERVVTELLRESPRNGNYLYLRARVLTARLAEDAAPDALARAQEAWEALLADVAIRTRAPERYWEARYEWLRLALRSGRAADVNTAITQERVWYPDLGGSPWKERLVALLAEARQALGLPPDPGPAAGPETAPATSGAPAGV